MAASTSSPPTTKKILEASGLLLFIIGAFVCTLFLFHSSYAFIGPVVLVMGVALVCAGRYVNYRHYRAVHIHSEEERNERKVTEEPNNGHHNIVTKGPVYTNTGYVGSQPGLSSKY